MMRETTRADVRAESGPPWRLPTTSRRRYHVFGVSGFALDPTKGRGSGGYRKATRAYSVLDAHDAWREVAAITPGRNAFARAETLADELELDHRRELKRLGAES